MVRQSSDVAEITLMSPGDIVFLYSDGVYDGSRRNHAAADRIHLAAWEVPSEIPTSSYYNFAPQRQTKNENAWM